VRLFDDDRTLLLVVAALVASSLCVVFFVLRAQPDTDQERILAFLRGRHSAEEDSLVMFGATPWLMPVDSAGTDDFVVDLVFLFSRHHCGNCVRDEVVQLNRIQSMEASSSVRKVVGYSLDSPSDSIALNFNSTYLGAAFPIIFDRVVRDHYEQVLGYTPVLFVTDAASGTILDVHRPIPTDSEELSAFYKRWYRILRL